MSKGGNRSVKGEAAGVAGGPHKAITRGSITNRCSFFGRGVVVLFSAVMRIAYKVYIAVVIVIVWRAMPSGGVLRGMLKSNCLRQCARELLGKVE